jgi:hypothetical protein
MNSPWRVILLASAALAGAAAAEAQFSTTGPQCGWQPSSSTRDFTTQAVVGNRTTITIIVDFSDATVPCSVADLQSQLFTGSMSVDRFTRESSCG